MATTKQQEDLIIGIDLGTTNSCVAIHHFGRSEVIANDLGARTTPSIVYLGSGGDNLVGAPAKQMSVNSPQCTVFGAKRMIGRRFNDAVIQDDIKLWPYKVIQKDGYPQIQIEHDGEIRNYTPEEVSGVILSKMRKIAEDFLGQSIEKAVITVPANFNSLQRNATKVAAKHAGLTVPRILNEPTAAAFAYGYQSMERGKDKQHILIYDFGGGTLDVSIVVADNGIFQVLGTDGDTHLGGEDFDNALVDHCLEQFEKQTGLDPRGNSRVLRKLRGECERAKCSLSSMTKTFIEVSFKGEEVVLEISRALFEKITSKTLERCIQPVRSLLTRLQLPDSSIDEIILVGGTTRIPKIQSTIINSFPKFRSEEKSLCKTVNADEVVAVGASLQAAVLSTSTFQETKGIEIVDVIPLSLGLKTADHKFKVLLQRNSILPTTKSIEIPLSSLYISLNQFLMLFEGEDQDINTAYALDKINISRILQTNTDPDLILKIQFEVDKHGNLSLSVLPSKNNNDTNGIFAYFDGAKLIYHKYGDSGSNTKDNNNTGTTNPQPQSTTTTTQQQQTTTTPHLPNQASILNLDDVEDLFFDFEPMASNTQSQQQPQQQQPQQQQHPSTTDHNPLLLSRLDISPNGSMMSSNASTSNPNNLLSPLGHSYNNNEMFFSASSTTTTPQLTPVIQPNNQSQQSTTIPQQPPTPRQQQQPVIQPQPTQPVQPIQPQPTQPIVQQPIQPQPTQPIVQQPVQQPTQPIVQQPVQQPIQQQPVQQPIQQQPVQQPTKTVLSFDDDFIDDILDDFMASHVNPIPQQYITTTPPVQQSQPIPQITQPIQQPTPTSLPSKPNFQVDITPSQPSQSQQQQPHTSIQVQTSHTQQSTQQPIQPQQSTATNTDVPILPTKPPPKMNRTGSDVTATNIAQNTTPVVQQHPQQQQPVYQQPPQQQQHQPVYQQPPPQQPPPSYQQTTYQPPQQTTYQQPPVQKPITQQPTYQAYTADDTLDFLMDDLAIDTTPAPTTQQPQYYQQPPQQQYQQQYQPQPTYQPQQQYQYPTQQQQPQYDPRQSYHTSDTSLQSYSNLHQSQAYNPQQSQAYQSDRRQSQSNLQQSQYQTQQQQPQPQPQVHPDADQPKVQKKEKKNKKAKEAQPFMAWQLQGTGNRP